MIRYFIYAAAAFALIFALGTIGLRIRDRAVHKSRKDDKIEDFIDHFVSEGISGELALSVYHYLQNWMNCKEGFPVRSQDDIGEIYGIVEGDHDDLILEIADANNLVAPPNADYWKAPLNTVEEVIRFIASFPKKD